MEMSCRCRCCLVAVYFKFLLSQLCPYCARYFTRLLYPVITWMQHKLLNRKLVGQKVNDVSKDFTVFENIEILGYLV